MPTSSCIYTCSLALMLLQFLLTSKCAAVAKNFTFYCPNSGMQHYNSGFWSCELHKISSTAADTKCINQLIDGELLPLQNLVANGSEWLKSTQQVLVSVNLWGVLIYCVHILTHFVQVVYICKLASQSLLITMCHPRMYNTQIDHVWAYINHTSEETIAATRNDLATLEQALSHFYIIWNASHQVRLCKNASYLRLCNPEIE